ncbi:MAG TPA: phage terminase large subunit [Candidatus Cybelea sp.]|jgi:predicted phage terminase large subunit-like protein|nr:phage terminase large subunit [Candidatus Cybelea sp.]
MSVVDAGRRSALTAAVQEELARRSLLDFCDLAYPKFQAPSHIRFIARLLERISNGEGKNIAISVPVRHGKSVLCSQCFPAFHLGRHPTDQIILASHSESLAAMNSRIAKHIVEDSRYPFDVKLSSDSASVTRWNVTAGGGCYAIGVGGSITGRGFTCGIVDDALHDGLSESESESCWDWFREIFVPRSEPGARLVVIGARLSSTDLIGRIADSNFAGDFEFVKLPALAEEHDPLGRAPGEALWPERMSVEEIEQRRAMMGSFAFESQFQQAPISRVGAMVKYDWLVHDKAFPTEFERILLAIDPASKATKNADDSAAVVVGRKKGEFYVLDCVLAKVELPELKRLLINMYEKWRPSSILCEDSANGIGCIQMLRRSTTLPIVPIKALKSKISRVEGILGVFESRRVHFPAEAPWLSALERQLLAFPSFPKDDAVDALTMALARFQTQPVEWSFAFANTHRS